MSSDERSFVEAFEPTASQLWVIAVLFFGIGDVVTTVIGLKTAGVVEVHPIAAALFERSILASMVVLKSAAFGSCYVLWKLTPDPYSVGVPLGLIVLGVCVTLWNGLLLSFTAFT